MMKFRVTWLPLLAAAALAVPGTVWAQEDDEPRPGMIGVMFDADDDEDGVRIVEVRRGSPADRAGLQEGDIVIRLNGRDADEAFEELPDRLQAGDSVRMRIRRRDGGERDVVVVAVPRPATRFGMLRPGRGEPLIIVNGDSIRVPLEAITMHIDSLHTRLLHLDSGRVRVQMDSLVHLFRDSANVFIRRMPNVEVHIAGPELEAMRLEALEGLEELDLEGLEQELLELNGETFNLDTELLELGGHALEAGRPFFMELGRRAAAGAELAEMNEGLSRYFGNVRSGALVIDVAGDTPAARAGLEPGDVIVRAAGRDVNDPEDVRRALMRAENGRVALEVLRQGRRRELTLEWDDRTRVIRSEVAPARARARVRGRVVPAPTRAPREN
jgi:hypothetical protein